VLQGVGNRWLSSANEQERRLIVLTLCRSVAQETRANERVCPARFVNVGATIVGNTYKGLTLAGLDFPNSNFTSSVCLLVFINQSLCNEFFFAETLRHLDVPVQANIEWRTVSPFTRVTADNSTTFPKGSDLSERPRSERLQDLEPAI
jgi:hypothetical protein